MTKREERQRVQPAYAGKGDPGKGRVQIQTEWDNRYEHKVDVVQKEVRVSKFVLHMCPGARAFTYADVKGTDIRLMGRTTLQIPDAYMESSYVYAASHTDL